MSRVLVALSGLSPSYADAFNEWAAGQDCLILTLPDDGAPPVAAEELSLCVVEMHGDRAGCLQRLRLLRKITHRCPVVVLTRDISVDTAIALMHEGAADVIELPAAPADVVARAALQATDSGHHSGDTELVGQSPAIQALRKEIQTLARLRSTVLLIGETGVGKGLIARLIHELSDRRKEPFVHADCASLAGSVIESELFGHERGAFTGAVGRRTGRFEQAGTGTIFLDEVGELPLPLQTKLLRVLHDRSYERIGGSKTLRMNARVIAATNRNLAEDVRREVFRSDLYFRLRVFELRIPPLRERLSDLPLLVRAGMEELAPRLSVTLPRVQDGFYRALMRHDWPGNVRELYHLLERLLVTREGDVLDEQCVQDLLPSLMRLPRSESTPPETPCAEDSETDRERIAGALVVTGGNVARAARRLGIPRSTLRYRIRRYDLSSLIPDD